MRAKKTAIKPLLSLPIRIIAISAFAYVASHIFLSATKYDWKPSVESYFGLLPAWLEPFAMPMILITLPLLISAIAAIVCTYLMFDRPINKLEQAFRKAEGGNFLIRAPISSKYELGQLASRFNRMLTHITDMAARQTQAEHELIVAQKELKHTKQLEEQKRRTDEANERLELVVKDLSLLYEIGQELSTIADLSVLYNKLADTLFRYLHLSQLAILIHDEKKDELQVKASRGFHDEDKVLSTTFKFGEGISGRAAATGQRIYVKDTTTDERFLHYKGATPMASSSFLAVPLQYKGTVLGVINYARDGIDKFSFADVRMLTMVANQVSLAISNAKLFTRMRQLSVTDELTGLYNRRHFQQSLGVEWKRAVRFHRPLSLIIIDVDHFKLYNDAHGHPKGDAALKRLAQTMKHNLREVDSLARFGGEEFIAMLPDTDKHGAIAVAEKLRRLIEQLDINIDEKTLLTISVGIASYPDDVNAVEDLVDHADVALYKAKEMGRNKVVCFKPPARPQKAEGEAAPKKDQPKQDRRSYVQ